MSKLNIEADDVAQIVKVMQGQKRTHNREFWAGFFGAVGTLVDGVNKGFDTHVKVLDQRIKVREIDDKKIAEDPLVKAWVKAAKQAEEAEAEAAAKPGDEAAKAKAKAAKAVSENAKTDMDNLIKDYDYAEKKTTIDINKEKKEWMIKQETLNYALAGAKTFQDICKLMALNSTPSKGELDLTGKLLTADTIKEVTNQLGRLNKKSIVESAYNKADRAKFNAHKAMEAENNSMTQADRGAATTAKNLVDNHVNDINTLKEELKGYYTTVGDKNSTKEEKAEALRNIDAFDTEPATTKADTADKQAKIAIQATKAHKYRRFASNLKGQIQTLGYDNINTAFANDEDGTDRGKCRLEALRINDAAAARQLDDNNTPEVAKQDYDFIYGKAKEMKAALNIAKSLTIDEQVYRTLTKAIEDFNNSMKVNRVL